MRLLVVFSHPCPESFGAALFETACRTLRAAGHELRCHDLYAEGFNPVLSTEERRQYLTDTAAIIAKHPEHIDNLQWAEGLVVIYPTWYYGPPAMLKGWLERVWLPGITFEVVPVWIWVTVTTAGSNTGMRRVTSIWSAWTISQATGMGSSVRNGSEA